MGEDHTLSEARKLVQVMLTASAKALESFAESVGAATDLFDHEQEIRGLASDALALASRMRRLSTEM